MEKVDLVPVKEVISDMSGLPREHKDIKQASVLSKISLKLF